MDYRPWTMDRIRHPANVCVNKIAYHLYGNYFRFTSIVDP